VALNWANDQPRNFYDQLHASGDPAFPALKSALDDIEANPGSAAARHRSFEAVIAPPPVWLVHVRHPSGDLQILWQEDPQGDPAPLWIGAARFRI